MLCCKNGASFGVKRGMLGSVLKPLLVQLVPRVAAADTATASLHQ